MLSVVRECLNSNTFGDLFQPEKWALFTFSATVTVSAILPIIPILKILQGGNNGKDANALTEKFFQRW